MRNPFEGEHADVVAEAEQMMAGLDPEQITVGIPFREIEKLARGDAALEELVEDLRASCHRYTASVCRMERMARGDDRSEMQVADETRQRIHDGLIAMIKIVARNLAKRGRDGSWIKRFRLDGKEDFGDDLGQYNRLACGALALRTTFEALLAWKKHEVQERKE